MAPKDLSNQSHVCASVTALPEGWERGIAHYGVTAEITALIHQFYGARKTLKLYKQGMVSSSQARVLG